MSAPQHPDAENIVARFRCWIERAVMALNLCPFARKPYEGDRVRYVVSDAGTPEQLLANLERELELLRETDAGNIETTLLIHPDTLQDFLDYNEFLAVVDDALERGGYVGEFQVASLHPEYRFAGTEKDDVENYTNRSPYPALHILREAGIEQALTGFATPEQIPERNIRAMQKLGAERMRGILAECMEIKV